LSTSHPASPAPNRPSDDPQARCGLGQRLISSAVHTIEHDAIWWSQRPLFCLLAGLIGGCILGTAAISPTLILLLCTGVALVWPRWPYAHLQRCCRLLLAGLLLAHMHLAWRQQALPLDHIAHLLHAMPRQRITVEGRLYRPVEPRGDRQYVYLRLRRLRDTQQWRRVTGQIRLNVHTTDLAFWPGDVIQVHRLRLYPIRSYQNPGGFNFRQLMHRQNIYAIGGVSRPERLHLVHRPTGWQLARTLVRWRRYVANRVHPHLPATVAPVFFAMVLGQRGELSRDIQQAFHTAGIGHLLVVSGLHIGVVMLGFFVSLRAILRLIRSWLPRHWVPTWRPTPVAAFLCLPPVLLYCYLVGWKVSTIRAALMVGCSVLALAVSRSRDLRYALSLAAALILLCDPYALFSLGFQLSFTAVAAVIVAGQYVTAHHTEPTTHWRFWRLAFWFVWLRRIWASALVSGAAFVSTTPLLAGVFHIVPSYSILTNMVLVPVAGIIVPVGVVGLGLAVISPGLASIVFALLVRLLDWALTLVYYVAAQPGAQLYVAAPSAYVMLTYYSLLVSLLLSPRRRWRRAAAGFCSLLLLGSIAWQYLESRTPQLRVTFIDVGTGDAIVIETPDQHRILIDGGGTYNGRFDIGARVVAPMLWQRFIRRLDLMAMTHTHSNHARGLVSLLKLFPSPHVLTNGSPFNTDYLREFRTLCASRGTQLHTAQTGPRHWQWGDVHLTVLAPPSATHPHRATWQPLTENDRSLVIRLQYRDIRILFTGDIEHATERWLLTHVDDLRADILQIAHHGSRTSTLPDFVKRVQPQVGLISVGAGNPYGHPHPQVLATLQQHHVRLFRTDRHGAITLTTDGTTYHIAPFRPYHPPLPIRIPSAS